MNPTTSYSCDVKETEPGNVSKRKTAPAVRKSPLKPRKHYPEKPKRRLVQRQPPQSDVGDASNKFATASGKDSEWQTKSETYANELPTAGNDLEMEYGDLLGKEHDFDRSLYSWDEFQAPESHYDSCSSADTHCAEDQSYLMNRTSWDVSDDKEGPALLETDDSTTLGADNKGNDDKADTSSMGTDEEGSINRCAEDKGHATTGMPAVEPLVRVEIPLAAARGVTRLFRSNPAQIELLFQIIGLIQEQLENAGDSPGPGETNAGDEAASAPLRPPMHYRENLDPYRNDARHMEELYGRAVDCELSLGSLLDFLDYEYPRAVEGGGQPPRRGEDNEQVPVGVTDTVVVVEIPVGLARGLFRTEPLLTVLGLIGDKVDDRTTDALNGDEAASALHRASRSDRVDALYNMAADCESSLGRFVDFLNEHPPPDQPPPPPARDNDQVSFAIFLANILLVSAILAVFVLPSLYYKYCPLLFEQQDGDQPGLVVSEPGEMFPDADTEL